MPALSVWLLEKTSNMFLTYFIPAGSRYWQNGTFEVKKSESEQADSTESPQPGHVGPPKNALQVVVPSELEGVAYIQVAIKKVSGGGLELLCTILIFGPVRISV